MTVDHPPCVQERYRSALNSSHLQVSIERTGAVDFFIAAGWVQESFGTLLYRLMTEFDAVRGEAKQAKSARADRVLLLNRLQTLRPATKALGAYAIGQATRQRFMRSNDEVLALCANVMSFWLDPICASCERRGFNGGHLKPRLMCTACTGAGLRPVRLGFDDSDREGHEFGRYLLARMDSKTEKVGRDIGRFIRQWVDGRGVCDAAANDALQDRLQELRSTQAQED